MSSYQQIAKIVKTEILGPDIVRITLAAYDIAKSAKPGQFVMVRAANGLDPLLRRPFSIHQVMDNGTLQILFKIIGKGTRYLAKLDYGDELDIVGPLGNSFNIAEKGAICLVGGGMGIAPMLFLAKNILRNLKNRQLMVILGARNRQEISQLLDDFNELGVTLYHSTDDGSSGHHGFVTHLLTSGIEKSGQQNWQVACCGPTIMMKKIAAICQLNNFPCQVSMETMMACGIGACLGCTIERNGLPTGKKPKYLHVCKNGPVFNAEEIWL